ncbi:hypothetical protein Ciccas_001061 [Cichlidogyrus casuarinus]|uniref:Uncharacterized protein n=1 Tax=Cichlidogyrus casuarinus TaxID=1844966 RepID=A0ABD2QL66_9PLAT
MRQVTRYGYKKNHCHCVNKERTSQEPCACLEEGKVVNAKVTCDTNNYGSPVRIIQTFIKTWSPEEKKCTVVEKTVQKELSGCLANMNVEREPCKKDGTFVETLIKFELDKESCTCKKVFTKQTKSCKCPSKRQLVNKCEETGLQYLIVTEYQWEEPKGCVETKKYVKQFPCACPEGQFLKKCHNGMLLVQKTSYIKDHEGLACVKEVQKHAVMPKCESDEPRFAETDCDRNTCQKFIQRFEMVYNPAYCKCEWKKVSEMPCVCCGCPKPRIETKCLNDNILQGSIVLFSPNNKKCSTTCVRQVKHTEKVITCKANDEERPQVYWGECDPKTCDQFMLKELYEPIDCKCQKRLTKIAKRKCCCPKDSRVRELCHNGYQLEIRSFLQLEGHQCVWKENVAKHLLSCQSKGRIVHGSCRPETCKQPLYRLTKVLNKKTCTCEEQETFLGEKECCCLEKPSQNIVCLGDCREIITVTPQFDQQQQKCIVNKETKKQCLCEFG